LAEPIQYNTIQYNTILVYYNHRQTAMKVTMTTQMSSIIQNIR